MAAMTPAVLGNQRYCRLFFERRGRAGAIPRHEKWRSSMKRIGLAVTTAIILATTVPAVAQRYDYDGRGWWGGERHHRYYGYRPYRHSYRYYHRDCYRDGYGCGRGYGYRSWWGGRRY